MLIKLNNGNYYPVISMDDKRPPGIRIWVWETHDRDLSGRGFFYDNQLFDFEDEWYTIDNSYRPKLIQELGIS